MNFSTIFEYAREMVLAVVNAMALALCLEWARA